MNQLFDHLKDGEAVLAACACCGALRPIRSTGDGMFMCPVCNVVSAALPGGEITLTSVHRLRLAEGFRQGNVVAFFVHEVQQIAGTLTRGHGDRALVLDASEKMTAAIHRAARAVGYEPDFDLRVVHVSNERLQQLLVYNFNGVDFSTKPQEPGDPGELAFLIVDAFGQHYMPAAIGALLDGLRPLTFKGASAYGSA